MVPIRGEGNLPPRIRQELPGPTVWSDPGVRFFKKCGSGFSAFRSGPRGVLVDIYRGHGSPGRTPVLTMSHELPHLDPFGSWRGPSTALCGIIGFNVPPMEIRTGSEDSSVERAIERARIPSSVERAVYAGSPAAVPKGLAWFQEWLSLTFQVKILESVWRRFGGRQPPPRI